MRLRGRVVRICVSEASLTLISYTSIGMNVCCSAYDNVHGQWCVFLQWIEY